MSTLIIGLIVVAASAGVAWITVFSHGRTPSVRATLNSVTVPSSDQAADSASQKDDGNPLRVPILVRLRSFLLLVILTLGIACLFATVIGLGVMALSFLLS